MKRWRIGLIATLATLASLAQAGEFRLAAASNLQPLIQALSQDYTRQTGHTLQTSFGASGKLFAQISHGAPFDVLMSADLKYPQALLKQGQAQAPLVHNANGVLVIWTAGKTLPPDWPAWLQSAAVQKIAIAHPDTAPYGREALRVMQSILPAVQHKLVYGENIAQTSQFILSGAAQVGFSAKSIVANPAQRPVGTWREIPQSQHQPIAQGAVITQRGAGNPAAQAFMTYLQSAAAKTLLRQYGYLPAKAE